MAAVNSVSGLSDINRALEFVSVVGAAVSGPCKAVSDPRPLSIPSTALQPKDTPLESRNVAAAPSRFHSIVEALGRLVKWVKSLFTGAVTQATADANGAQPSPSRMLPPYASYPSAPHDLPSGEDRALSEGVECQLSVISRPVEEAPERNASGTVAVPPEAADGWSIAAYVPAPVFNMAAAAAGLLSGASSLAYNAVRSCCGGRPARNDDDAEDSLPFMARTGHSAPQEQESGLTMRADSPAAGGDGAASDSADFADASMKREPAVSRPVTPSADVPDFRRIEKSRHFLEMDFGRDVTEDQMGVIFAQVYQQTQERLSEYDLGDMLRGDLKQLAVTCDAKDLSTTVALTQEGAKRLTKQLKLSVSVPAATFRITSEGTRIRADITAGSSWGSVKLKALLAIAGNEVRASITQTVHNALQELPAPPADAFANAAAAVPVGA